MNSSGRPIALLLTLVLGVLGVLAPGIAGPAVAADDPPPIDVTLPDPTLPSELATSTQRRWQLRLPGTGTPTTTTVTVAGDGVRSSPAERVVDSSTTTYPSFALTADPGVHTVTITVTREGWATRSADYTVWVSGGEPLVGEDSLAGRSWAAPEAAYYSDGRYNRQQSAVWFVDDTHAVLGWPAAGLPDCPTGCLPYFYDAASGLVQVGGVAIGRVTERGVYLDGALPPGDDWEDGQAWFDQPVDFWAPKRRVSGRWRWTDGDALPSETGPFALRLRRDGRFRVTDAGRSHTGRYVLRRAGLLRLRGDHGWSRKATVARCLDDAGHPRPGRCVTLSWAGLDAGGGVLLPAPQGDG